MEKVQAMRRNYRAKNKEKVRISIEGWRKANPEKAKANSNRWRKTKPELAQLYDKKYRAENKAVFRAGDARRRACELNATPSWADKGAILGFYKAAQGLSMLLGEWYHVDHIVPLRGKTVCGLHCEANLQVLPALENLKKKNLFWPDMPEREML